MPNTSKSSKQSFSWSTVEKPKKYPRSDFFSPVLRLGEQVYQISYFFTLSDQQPGRREAAGRVERGVRHNASTRRGSL